MGKKTGKKAVAEGSVLTGEPDAIRSAIVRKLIRAGKDKGYLSYDEVNNILPGDVTSSGELDEVMEALHNADIKVVESVEVVTLSSLAASIDRSATLVSWYAG